MMPLCLHRPATPGDLWPPVCVEHAGHKGDHQSKAEFTSAGPGVHETETVLDRPVNIRLTDGSSDLAEWTVAVIPDDTAPAEVAATVSRLHDGGARVFVDLGAGAQGDLAPVVARALDGRAHVTVTALAPGTGPLARLDRALAALWAEGAAVLPDALHRPAPAGPCPALGPWHDAGAPTEPTPIDQGEA